MRILIVTSITKPLGQKNAEILRNWLVERGHSAEIVTAEEVVSKCRISQEVLDSKMDFDMIFSLGGDGTMLTSAQLAFHHDAPILGFNFGTLGFLTGASPDKLLEGAQAAIEGRLEAETRSALDVEIVDASGQHSRYKVLNEVNLSRGLTGKMFRYTITIDDDQFAKMFSDGVIVSSPTGSTAYSLSAGGPILYPQLACMVVVAVAPHSLVSRALVTGPRETVCIEPENAPDRDCTVFLDGHCIPELGTPQKVIVRVCPDAVTFLNYNAPGFTRAASRVFYGGGE